jgi:hypothetical protein
MMTLRLRLKHISYMDKTKYIKFIMNRQVGPMLFVSHPLLCQEIRTKTNSIFDEGISYKGIYHEVDKFLLKEKVYYIS